MLENIRNAKTRLFLTALLLAVALSRESLAQQLDVPFIPTPQAVVDKMLEMAKVGPKDFLVDLGSGDGRIPITAAKRFGARGYGVDLNVALIVMAEGNAREAGVADKVQFAQKDLFETDISKASVLTLYLGVDLNLRVRQRIFQQMKPGSRVVSHDYDMGDWKPDRMEIAAGKKVYLWTVPPKGQGPISVR